MNEPQYAELHCRTNFSFLEGASHADELVGQAAQLGYHALAVTDRNSLAGVVRAHSAAKDVGLKLLIGAELHPLDAPPVVLWAPDRAAYGRLSRLITLGRRRAPKGECALHLEDIAAHSAGLLAGVLPAATTTARDLQAYREIFSDRGYLLAELFRGPDDARRLAKLQTLAHKSRLPLTAAGDIRYHTPRRQALADVLTCIRHGVALSQAEGLTDVNAERHLRPIAEIAALFHREPAALRRTLEVAERCTFSLAELRYEYPIELAPAGRTPLNYLRELTWAGAHKRYAGEVPLKVRNSLEKELQLIGELRYEAYFLTVRDAVRFARSRGILCQGRGSAANSAVCYCLEVTEVDPETTDLFFERFISKERNEAPDIDVDFEHERREEVLQYLYDKYGRERCGMTAVVITYRVRSAVRDVGKALGMSLDRVDALAKQMEGYKHEAKFSARCSEAGLDPESELGRRFAFLVSELIGFPRHLSQHVGGLVMTQGPLHELVPIENAAMEGRTVIEWDKDDLDELGILKVDCLCLGMLTAIRKCFGLIAGATGREITLAGVPREDPAVYEMIQRADTMGVFQIESRAQMSMLPRLKPEKFYDLVIEVAIVRPGPIQGDMVHPYLRRRAGDEQVPLYPTPEIQAVLDKTLGVPLFQEQAMRLAVVAAGFTPGEADQLRRAMAGWRKPGLIDQFQKKLIDGMRAKGLAEEFAERVFNQIRGFGEYGFPESHAASFALLVYISAWLKRHYPAAFCAALINSQPMGFYAPAQLIRDAREHGVAVRPIDVNHSDWDCTLEHGALRLGMRLISGWPATAAKRLESARAAGPFTSVDNFTRRTHLPRHLIAKLAEADAFDSLQLDRRAALWQSLAQERGGVARPLFCDQEEDESPPALPPLSPLEQVFADYRTAGLSLKAHPVSFFRPQLDRLRVTSAAGLSRAENDRAVCVAGLVLLRQRPSTAKGITFVTLEDETGVINLVVKQPVWERFYAVARVSPVWLAHGTLERRGPIIHIVVAKIEDLSRQLRMAVKSRDFR